ncbi:hypothetical protein HN51_041138, partial [Arachis hypogaea]
MGVSLLVSLNDSGLSTASPNGNHESSLQTNDDVHHVARKVSNDPNLLSHYNKQTESLYHIQRESPDGPDPRHHGGFIQSKNVDQKVSNDPNLLSHYNKQTESLYHIQRESSDGPDPRHHGGFIQSKNVDQKILNDPNSVSDYYKQTESLYHIQRESPAGPDPRHHGGFIQSKNVDKKILNDLNPGSHYYKQTESLYHIQRESPDGPDPRHHVAATTTITFTTTRATLAASSSSIPTIIFATTTSVPGIAATAQCLPQQHEEDNDVQIVTPPPLVVSVAQFYNNDGTLRASNLDVETIELWQSQIFLPLRVTGILHSFLGSLSTQEQIDSISSFFPSPREDLFIFYKNIKASYFANQVFRTALPKESSSLFLIWMSRLAPTYKSVWKSVGITSAIKLATFDLSYSAPLLGASLYFWCPTTNNFYFSYGMMSPTLIEMYALTGMLPDEECVSWSTEYPDDIFDINFDSTTMSGFIQNNMGFDDDSITDSEH